MPRTIRSYDTHPITIREVRVDEILDVTPGMRRVIVTGPQLDAFERQGFAQPPVVSDGFDDHIKILFAPPGEELTLPEQADGHCNWERSQLAMTRNYTVRWFAPCTRRMAIDFVRHGAGPATTWAYECRVGDRAWFAGPKECAGFPHGVDWHLVAGDETALPAIGRWLEEAPPGTRGQVFIEVAETDHVQHDLPEREGIEVTWLVRAEATGNSLLEDAVRGADWWPGSCYAFVAGEALAIKPIRRFLKGDRGLPPERLEVVGYWRRTAAEVARLADGTEAEPGDGDDEEHPALVLHEMGELMPPIVLRAAVTAGLPQAWTSGLEGVDELSAATGVRPEPLVKLLRALVAIGVARTTDRGFGPTALGVELDEERARDQFDLNRPTARDAFALTGLLDALGISFSTDGAALARHRSAAEELHHIASDVAKLDVFDTATTIGLTGYGTPALAEALLRLRPAARVVAAATAEIEEWLGTEVRRNPDNADRASVQRVTDDLVPAPDGDVVVLAKMFTRRSDADILTLLDSIITTRGSGDLVVIDEFRDPDSIDEHDCEHDLVALSSHGNGVRSAEETAGLLTSAGYASAEIVRVGWGNHCLVARH